MRKLGWGWLAACAALMGCSEPVVEQKELDRLILAFLNQKIYATGPWSARV